MPSPPKLTTEEKNVAYKKAVGMWRSGEFTLRYISGEVSLSPSYLSQRMKKDGETKGSDKKEIQKVAKGEIKEFQDDRLEEYSELATEIMTKTLKGVKLVQDTRLRLIVECLKEKKKIHFIYGELKALVEAGKGMKNDWELVKDVLGLNHEDDDDGAIPELVYREMTEEDIERVRAEQRAQYEEMLGEVETKVG